MAIRHSQSSRVPAGWSASSRASCSAVAGRSRARRANRPVATPTWSDPSDGRREQRLRHRRGDQVERGAEQLDGALRDEADAGDGRILTGRRARGP